MIRRGLKAIGWAHPSGNACQLADGFEPLSQELGG